MKNVSFCRTVRDKYETILYKRFIDILTVSLGSQTEGPTFEQIIKQQGNIYGGMYPSFTEDADREEMENPISIVKERSGETVHFLDMEIVQSKPGVSQIRMYDKRDHMATFAEYRRYPHVEARLSQSCIRYTSLPNLSVCNKMYGDPIFPNSGSKIDKGYD